MILCNPSCIISIIITPVNILDTFRCSLCVCTGWLILYMYSYGIVQCNCVIVLYNVMALCIPHAILVNNNY